MFLFLLRKLHCFYFSYIQINCIQVYIVTYMTILNWPIYMNRKSNIAYKQMYLNRIVVYPFEITLFMYIMLRLTCLTILNVLSHTHLLLIYKYRYGRYTISTLTNILLIHHFTIRELNIEQTFAQCYRECNEFLLIRYHYRIPSIDHMGCIFQCFLMSDLILICICCY